MVSQYHRGAQRIFLRGKSCCRLVCYISPLKLKLEEEWGESLPRADDEGSEREGVGVGERLEGCW